MCRPFTSYNRSQEVLGFVYAHDQSEVHRRRTTEQCLYGEGNTLKIYKLPLLEGTGGRRLCGYARVFQTL